MRNAADGQRHWIVDATALQQTRIELARTGPRTAGPGLLAFKPVVGIGSDLPNRCDPEGQQQAAGRVTVHGKVVDVTLDQTWQYRALGRIDEVNVGGPFVALRLDC